MEDDPPAKVKDDRSVKFNIPSPEQDALPTTKTPP